MAPPSFKSQKTQVQGKDLPDEVHVKSKRESVSKTLWGLETTVGMCQNSKESLQDCLRWIQLGHLSPQWQPGLVLIHFCFMCSVEEKALPNWKRIILQLWLTGIARSPGRLLGNRGQEKKLHPWQFIPEIVIVGHKSSCEHSRLKSTVFLPGLFQNLTCRHG